MKPLKCGWHMPSFPVDGSNGATFIAQIHQTLQRIHPQIQSVWVDDHVMPWATWQPRETPYLECVTTIGYFAGAYPTLEFGASVFCQSYRNPALLAKMAANLQLVTGGRLLFGIGAGWMESEYRAYNFPFPSPGVRIDQLNVNLLRFPSGDGVTAHVNTEVDVVLVIFEGSGELTVDGVVYSLHPGLAVVVPRGATRAMRCTVGPLVYLTCHRRRPGLMPS